MTIQEIQKQNIDAFQTEIIKLLNLMTIKYDNIPGVIDIGGDYTVTLNETIQANTQQSKIYKMYVALDEKLHLFLSDESKEIINKLDKNLSLIEKIATNSSFST